VRKLLQLALLLLLYAAPAFAGTCPSAANLGDGGLYGAPSNCFYIDFVGGADTNAGTTEGAPLKHTLGMVGCANNCSTLPGSGTTGTGIIFKGGITWDWTIFPWTTRAGSGGTDSFNGCAGNGCYYYGVDKTWFTGGSWTRPIFSGGDWSNPGTNTTCFYDTNGVSIPFINNSAHKWVIIDSFEFTGMCNTTGTGGGLKPSYIENTNGSGGDFLTIENNYFHRWTFPASAVPTKGDYSSAAVLSDAHAHWTYNVVDGTDAGPTTTYTSGGQGTGSPGTGFFSGEGVYSGQLYIDHNVFYNISQALDVALSSVHDNYFYNASATSVTGTTHPHISNDGGCSGNLQITWYNNVIDTVYSGQGWQPLLGPCTYFMFNNIWTNTNVARLLNWGPTTSTFYGFNNSMECGLDANPPSNVCGALNQATFSFYNSYFITSGFQLECGNGTDPACASWTSSAGTITSATFNGVPGGPVDILTQTKAVANILCGSYAGTYQFLPSLGCAAIGVGVNETTLCNTITDAAAQAACKKDTSYAVTYDQVNHKPVNSVRVSIARPSSGAWDVGAYQFSGVIPTAPANLLMGITYPAPGKILVTLSNAVTCAKTCKILLTCQTDCGPTYSGSVQ